MQYQIRRGGNVGPTSYTVEQLKEMYAGGSLVLSDEVSPAGQNQWKPLSQAFAGGQAAAAAPAANAGAEWLKRTVAQATSGDDWLMNAAALQWIFRGCLGAAILSTILPWFSASSSFSGGGHRSGMSYSVSGIMTAPGILVFLLAGASIGLTWVAVVRPWTFIGAALSLLVTMGAAFGIVGGSSSGSMAGGSVRASASMGAGFGAWLALIVLLGATTFGVFAFIQYLKKKAP